MILNITFVMIGGSIGALSRFIIDKFINKRIEHHIAFGTLGVNLLGLFIIGFTFGAFNSTFTINPHLKLFFVTGFLGALTTFSTYALQTFKLIEGKHYKHAINNILLNNILGMFLAYVGAIIGSSL